MNLNKKQYSFILLILILFIISIFFNLYKDNSSLINSKNNTMNINVSENQTRKENTNIEDSDINVFNNLEEKKDKKNKLEIEKNELNEQILDNNKEIKSTEKEIRYARGENIYNNTEWYNIYQFCINIYNKKNKVKLLEDKKYKLIEENSKKSNKIQEIENQLTVLDNDINNLRKYIDTNDFEFIAEKVEEISINKITNSFINKRNEYLQEFSLPQFILPCKGEITSEFGYRTHPIDGNIKYHSGIDIAVDTGTPIKASNYGLVIYSDWFDGFGKAIIISHGNGFYTLYGHNSELIVKKGDKIKQGDIIALAGSTGYSTGPHCHFSMWINNILVNPLENVII